MMNEEQKKVLEGLLSNIDRGLDGIPPTQRGFIDPVVESIKRVSDNKTSNTPAGFRVFNTCLDLSITSNQILLEDIYNNSDIIPIANASQFNWANEKPMLYICVYMPKSDYEKKYRPPSLVKPGLWERMKMATRILFSNHQGSSSLHRTLAKKKVSGLSQH